jgi:hypothetical protein
MKYIALIAGGVVFARVARDGTSTVDLTAGGRFATVDATSAAPAPG